MTSTLRRSWDVTGCEGFSLFKKIPSWDDLTFLPGTLTRFVIEGYREKCLTKTADWTEARNDRWSWIFPSTLLA